MTGISFSFDPDWQPLEQLSLDLLFQNDTLRMDSDGAMLGKAKAPRIVGWFPALMPDGELYINADVEGEAEIGTAIVDYGSITSMVNGSGMVKAKKSESITLATAVCGSSSALRRMRPGLSVV